MSRLVTLDCLGDNGSPSWSPEGALIHSNSHRTG
jgi:hypothetical protein